MEVIEYPEDVKAIRSFLDLEQCKELISLGEKMGFDEAAINTGNGQEIFKAIRNNERILFDDQKLARDLFEAIRAYVPNKLGDWVLCNLNERFRFYRYEQEQYFKWHRDGAYQRSNREESKITFMIYLNADYEGGNTDFREFRVKPEPGMALLFPHPIMHQGATVLSGVKYVLRTDVMYQKS